MLTVYAAGILPAKSIRPCFIYTANAEGAGKSLLVKLATVPVLGYVPNEVAPKNEDEMRKTLLSAVYESKPVICFDNYKGHLSSESLEGFVTSQDWCGRILGGQSTFRGDNNVVVFITSNGCTVSPDMRRRSLLCELFLEAERPEDRVFKNILDVPELKERREEILSALWSLVTIWHAAGEPPPSKSNASFPHWANTIGGIVEFSGYGCPLGAEGNQASADQVGTDMRALIKLMDERKPLPFEQLVALAETHGLFEEITNGIRNENTRPRYTSIFGKLLSSYDKRLVAGRRFLVNGKGHERRFQITSEL